MTSISAHEARLSDAQELDRGSLIPLFMQVAAIMRAKIVAWEVPAGTASPGEAELAGQYGVSRATVRKAYRMLDELGYTDPLEGGGHVVARDGTMTTIATALNSRVTARPPTPAERDALCLVPGTPVLEVTEPGKRPVVYDATRTAVEFAR
jgi:DNA-binding GntR family transcriptional regulator